MIPTYEGILHGDRIEWTKGGPPAVTATRVHVTLVDATPPPEVVNEAGRAALEAIAERGRLTAQHYQEWLESREDRALPGRED